MDGEACPRLESNLSPPSIRHNFFIDDQKLYSSFLKKQIYF